MRARLKPGFPAHVVDQVIEALAVRDLVDDTGFARMWRDSRTSMNPRSASAIRRELMAKGVPPEIATEAVREVDDPESAYRAGLKHARRLDSADSPTFRRKLWGYLQRRGFSASVARQTIDLLWNERHTSGGGSPDEAVGS